MKKLLITILLLISIASFAYALLEWITVSAPISGDTKAEYKELYGYYGQNLIDATILKNANKLYYTQGENITVKVPFAMQIGAGYLNETLIQNGVAVYSCSDLQKICDVELSTTLQVFLANNPDVKAVYVCP